MKDKYPFSYKNNNVASQTVPGGEGLKRRFIGDFHYGESGFDLQAFYNIMDDAEDEGRKVCLLGDIITSILPNDKRYEVEAHAESFSEQEEFLHNIFERYQDIIDWVLKGNHEDKLIGKHGDFLEKITNRYEIKYSGFQLNVLYRKANNKASYNIYMTHGRTTFNYKAGEDVRKEVNKRVRLKDVLRQICEADFYIQGHAHQAVMYTDPFDLRLVNNGGDKYEEHYKPVGEGKIYCCIPSLLRTYHKGENYAARWGVKPSDIGYIDLDLDKGLNVEDVKIVVSHENELKVKDSYKMRKKVVE